MAKTTVKIAGTEYPFYRTMRGSFDFSNTRYTVDQLAQGNVAAMLAALYYQVRDCARRASMQFDYTLETFVDAADNDVLSVFSRLNELEQKEAEEAKKKKEQEPKQMPEEPKA